jgi:hypothetical protein
MTATDISVLGLQYYFYHTLCETTGHAFSITSAKQSIKQQAQLCASGSLVQSTQRLAYTSRWLESLETNLFNAVSNKVTHDSGLPFLTDAHSSADGLVLYGRIPLRL